MWITVILLIILLYGLACLGVYLLQEWFIFRPEKLPPDFKYQYEYPFEEFFLYPEPQAVINGLLFKLPRSKGVIFYVKGNSRSVKGWGKFARDFLGKDYDFYMIDYRGFGKSRGKRSENAIYHDCQMAYNHLKTLYPEEKIIIYGRSMGSGFATYIAAQNQPQKLILDSPYYNFLETARRFVPFLPVAQLIKYHIRTDWWMPKVKCPVFILHGTKDRLIPFKSGKKLSQLNQNGTLIPIEDAGHNNLPRFAAYHDHLYAILNGVQRRYMYNSGIKASYD
ncbi:MAG TPA: alpha/beta fold hydrolase [Chitinophagales bacterium]|nr:alpha/beta fold hydrolase [Chitinophagales bacterium]HRK28455.1 alpha/beta fold hydrolase [Chitinophagales bacterium]